MIICPYCNNPAILVKGDKIYPHRKDLYTLNFWYCDNQHDPAYVGCHKISVKHKRTGIEPLGRLADSELRNWKSKAHTAFDPLWKEGKKKHFTSRTKAYHWLANTLNIEKHECHIGMFDIEMCQKVIQACKQLKE